MALTKTDLNKINKIVDERLAENNIKLLDFFVTKEEFKRELSSEMSKVATKKDLATFQEIVLEIKHKLDKE